MANNCSFQCGTATYTIDSCINGQSVMTMYDPLAQVALQRSLRDGTILCYNATGIEGLLSQLQALLGWDNRTVKANPFYWTEYCAENAITVCTGKSATVPGPGVVVTVPIAGPYAGNASQFGPIQKGYRAYIKELNGQAADIIDVVKTVNGAWTAQLRPLNGQSLDMTQLDQYTLLVDTLRMYIKGDTNCIPTEGIVQNPPTLRKGWVQKFEKGYCVHEDELDGYAYGVEFRILKGIDPLTGKKIDQWALPELMSKAMLDWIDNRNINLLFGVRDDVSQTGFDGLITVAEEEGAFNSTYNNADGVSLKTKLFNMVKQLRKINGCNDIMLLADFNFMMDWSEGIAALIKESGQSCTFALFGTGGEGERNFQWYQFKDFALYGYNFRVYQIDLFDNMRYGNFLSNFALVMPACKYKDTNGKVVPPVTMVNIEGSEPAKQKYFQKYDRRDQGCRDLDVFVRDAWGLEIHCGFQLGVIRKVAC